jgi:hypothetical protein
MPEFPHLPLIQTISGQHRPPRGGGDNAIDQRTIDRLSNRQQHGQQLLNVSNGLRADREQVIQERREAGLPEIPGSNAIPVFLQVDTNLFKVDSLISLGIEVISEEEDGFIIGASGDGFASLHNKIDKFLQEQGKYKNQAAQLWDIVAGNNWKPAQILSEKLYERWAILNDAEILTVDISVACYIKKTAQPVLNEGETNDHYQRRLENWQVKSRVADIAQADLSDLREEEVKTFLEFYNADINPEFVNFDDSFCFRVTLSGLGLKDFVNNYPFVFEIVEFIEMEDPIVIDGQPVAAEFEVLPPPPDAPQICVIDTGIQENHRLLEPAILPNLSHNYDPMDATTADLASHGGHGTRVAGAILYGEEIPVDQSFQAHCFLINVRILNRLNMMSSRLYQPSLMEDIVNRYPQTKIFNLSVNNGVPCRTLHMSPWAAIIDRLSHEENKLFIISTGNVKRDTGNLTNPGITEHLNNGRPYPGYLLEGSCRIANPAQSKFALTVGSVCLSLYEDDDLKSFGDRDMISSFSRTGLGLWGGIKPEVVEYGGDWVKEKHGPNLSQKESINPLLLRSGGAGVDRGAIGTSFAAPKVTHIASKLQVAYPDEPALLYKALIVQSARLPFDGLRNPTLQMIKTLGYGIPNLKRAMNNTERRVTMVDSAELAPGVARLYTINIPPELRRQGEEFDILIEVTLAYTARPRRTRRRTQSYLSSWLSFESSKYGEIYGAFRDRLVQHIDNVDGPMPQDLNSIPWAIWSNPIWGTIRGIKRQDNATQKDWTIVKSNALPEQLSFAVIGHKGWQNDLTKHIPFSFAVSVEALDGELQIYERIRAQNQVQIDIEQQQQIEI